MVTCITFFLDILRTTMCGTNIPEFKYACSVWSICRYPCYSINPKHQKSF